MNKKHLLLSLALCLMMPLSALAQLTAGDYYLQNVGSGLWLNFASTSGTTAVLADNPHRVTLTRISDGVFTIGTETTSGGFLNASGSSLGSSTNFTFTEVSTGIYTIQSSAGYMAQDGTTLAAGESGKSGAWYDVTMNSTLTNEYAQWRVKSLDDILADMASATETNPVNCTAFIRAANHNRRDGELSTTNWASYNSANVGFCSGFEHNWCAHFFNKAFDWQQTLNGLPAGKYELRAQGFYRYGANGDGTADWTANAATGGTPGAYLYAGSDQVALKSIYSEAVSDASFYTGSDFLRTTSGIGTYPYVKQDNETSTSAYKNPCKAFDNGMYRNSLSFQKLDDGPLNIGVRSSLVKTYEWTAFDNFELYYFGPLQDLTPYKDLYYALRTTIQDHIISQTSVYTDDGGAALLAYNAVLATQDDIVENATSEEEITAAKTALWNAALTFMKGVSINDGMGFDLTWMIGDADFSDSNYKNYWTEVLASSTTIGIVGGDNKILRYYNSSFDLSQTLAYTLPAGAYRMKADGFERTNDPRDTAWQDYQNGVSVVTGTLYLNNNEQLIMNLFDDQSVTTDVYGGKKPTGATFYIPDGSTPASVYLSAGLYENSLIGVVTEDGPVTIGYRCANTKAWTVIDNFRLEYIGEVPQVAISNEAGVLTPVCAPFTLSTDDASVVELYALAGEEHEGSLSIYPVNTVPAGTPCYAKFSIANYSAPMEMTLTNGKKFVMPWAGGWARVNAANDTWTYYGMDGDSHPDAEIGKVVLDFNDMEFDVNMENLAARRYLNSVFYSGSSEASEVATYNVAPPTRRDIPNAVMIPLPAHNDEIEITIQNSNLEEVVRIMVPAGATEAYVYNLLPQETYYFEAITGYRGQFHTKGHLRMVYAPSAYNIRDLGGWETQDGHRTTYGHLFRGSTLNGYVSATAEDLQTLRDLGVGGEIDLRYQESYDKDMGCGTSAFGFGADDYYFAAANDYLASDLNNSGTQGRLKAEFDFILNHFRQGKAVYFHCAWGADRTGMLSFLLEGLLGLTIDQIYKDYELTSFSVAGNRLKTSFQDRIDVILALDGATLRDKFENYFLNKLGVPMDDITYFRSVMLEVYPLTIDEDANVPAYYNGKADITLHRTLKAGMHNTVVLPCDLDLWKAEDLFGGGTKIENIVSYEDGVLKTEEITNDTDIAPANKPFLLVPTEPRSGNIYTLDDVQVREGELTAAEFTNGKMVGTYAAMDVAKSTETGKENYVISNDQFYVIGSSPAPMKSTRAYLVLDTPASGVKSIVTFDSEATGIDQVQSIKDDAPSTIYDLSGRRVGQPTRGLYIVNGKKVYVK